MSSVVETAKRWRMPLAAGAIIAALVLAGVIAGLVSEGAPQGGGGTRAGNAPRLAPPRIKQARWEVKSFPAGAVWEMTKRDRKQLRIQGRSIARLVRRVYDTLFLQPGRAPEILKRNFVDPAAFSLRRSRIGLPKRADDVQFLARRARIGIDGPSRRRAAGTVTLLVRGKAGGRRFRMKHESTLWLERTKRGWHVIAYDAQQGPQRWKARRDKGKAGRRGDDKRGDRPANRRTKRRRDGKDERRARSKDGARRDGRRGADRDRRGEARPRASRSGRR